jgi:hypothetical protein
MVDASWGLSSGDAMSTIFLSYRRGDAKGTTGRLFDWLEEHYGSDGIFMDTDDIPLGVDFRKHIQRYIAQAEVLLAVIGSQWNGLGPNGKRRLSDKADWIRIEIQLALEAQVAVVPLFVDGTDLPIPGRLPRSLRELAFHQAEHIDSGRDFPSHFERLVKKLDKLIEGRRAERFLSASPPSLVTRASVMPSATQLSPVETPRTVVAKPAKQASRRQAEPCVISVAEDLANQLAAIGKEKD